MKALPLLFVLSLASFAQTTYTTTQDGCGGKNLGYCTLPVTDQASNPFQLVLDARNAASGPINTLTVQAAVYPHAQVFKSHGGYVGFVANPNGTHAPYYGAGSFTSDDGTVNGQFTFYAYYIATCSGRGCAGTVVGWHFRVLVGSTVRTN